MTLLVEQSFLRCVSRNTVVSNKSVDRFRWNRCTIAKVSEIRTATSAADRGEEDEGGVKVTHVKSVQSSG